MEILKIANDSAIYRLCKSFSQGKKVVSTKERRTCLLYFEFLLKALFSGKRLVLAVSSKNG
jgi:hypothetical protein